MANDIQFTIGANASSFKVAIAQISQNVEHLRRTTSERMAAIGLALKGVTGIANGLRNVLAEPLKQFALYEDTATRLAPLVGGLATAKELAAELRDEAANGTAPLQQLASIAGRLATVFKDTASIKMWTTAFHDIAAGTGMDVNELVGNFVKAKASGRFEAGIMEMFAQKGVNIFPELEKQTGLAAAEIRKLAGEGKLAFAEIEKALLAVSTGTGKFAGQAKALSNTFGGSVETMRANWNIFLAELGKPFAELVTPALQKMSTTLRENIGIARGMPHAALIAGIGVAATVAAVKVASFCATSQAGLAGLAAAAQKAASGITTVGGALAVVTAAMSAATWWIVGNLEEDAAKNDALINATKRLSESHKLVTEAKSLEELEARVKAAERAWKGYEVARKRAGEKGGLNAETTQAYLLDIAERRRELLLLAEAEKAAAEAARQRAEAESARQEKQQAKDDLLVSLYQRQKLLQAEIDGNDALLERLKQEADLHAKIAEYRKAGLPGEDAEDMARRMQSLENQKAAAEAARQQAETAEKKNEEPATPDLTKYMSNPNRLGVGNVLTGQASIGGGRSLSLGADTAIAVARDQLAMLRQIARNTAEPVVVNQGLA